MEIGKGWKRGEEGKGRVRWRCVEMGWGQVEMGRGCAGEGLRWEEETGGNKKRQGDGKGMWRGEMGRGGGDMNGRWEGETSDSQPDADAGDESETQEFCDY